MQNQKPSLKLKPQKTKAALRDEVKFISVITASICSFLVLLAIATLLIPYRRIPPQRITVHESTRSLIAVAKGSDDVFLGWRLFGTDNPNVGFTIWRSNNPDSGFSCINGCNEIDDSTNYIDTGATGNDIYYYYVQSDEGKNSNIAQVTAKSAAPVNPEQYRQLGLYNIDVGGDVAVGDLNGDGLLDYVLSDQNQVNEDILPDRPGDETDGDGTLDCLDCTILIRAFSHDGTPMWVFDTGWYARQWDLDQMRWETNAPVPIVVWDMNSDGRAEVMARTDNGPDNDDDIHLTYLSIIKTNGDEDGPWTTDSTRTELPLPTEIAQALEARNTDPYNVYRVNFPNYLSVAYLDGTNTTPNLVIQNSVHDGERLTAFDINAETLEFERQRWDFANTDGYGPESEGYPLDPINGTGGTGYHGVMVYDMDGDGTDEVFDGSLLLDSNGDVLWTAKSEVDNKRLLHPDVVIPGNIVKETDELEVYFATESHPTGVYLFQANAASADLLWEHREGQPGGWDGHRDDGWIADILDASGFEGYEIYTWDVNNTEGQIFKESGELAWSDNCAYKRENYMNVIQWDDDETAEVFHQYNQLTNSNHQDYAECHDVPSSKKIKDAERVNDETLRFESGGVNFNEAAGSLRADVFGDWREEFFHTDGNDLIIYTNTDEINVRKVSRWENLEYRKDASRVRSSYWRYYNPIDFNITAPDLTIEDLNLDKDIFDPGGTGNITFKIQNNSSNPIQAEYWIYANRTARPGEEENPDYQSSPITLNVGMNGPYTYQFEAPQDSGIYSIYVRIGENFPTKLDEEFDSFYVTDNKIVVPGKIVGPETYTYRFFQAEDALEIFSPVRISPNGNYIGARWDPETTSCGGETGPLDSCGYAVYEFNIPEGQGGQYTILGKVSAPTGSRDSFWVEIDGVNAVLWDTLQGCWTDDPTVEGGDYWDRDLVSNRGSGNTQIPETNPYYFNLSSGNHTLKIYSRDDGTGLNSFLITNDGSVSGLDEGFDGNVCL